MIPVEDIIGRPAVYRLFGAEGDLLYVGQTSLSVGGRLAHHRTHRPWWPTVTHVAIDFFPTQADAVAAEKVAIRTEAPLHNRPCGVPPGRRAA